MTKVSPGTSLHQTRDDRMQALSQNHLLPGDAFSVDQYIVSEKGHLLTSFGRERQSDRYSGGTIFVDHASGKIFLHHQVSLNAGETLMGKRLLEREAHVHGIKIKKFHGDNGIFVSKEFWNDYLLKNQILDFSGVGTQHQNGRAERAICIITSLACAMLIQSALHWSESHDLALWPMAMDHAVWIWNNLPGADGLSPNEKFTGQKTENFDHLCRAHIWGAPVYVLKPKLQEGHKIPKFHPRSRQGKFVGFSKDHSSSVALILNHRTGKISPQFHCVFDNFFQTVCGVADANEINLNAIDWDYFIELTGTDKFFEDSDDPPPLHHDWSPPVPPPALRRPRFQTNERGRSNDIPPSPRPAMGHENPLSPRPPTPPLRSSRTLSGSQDIPLHLQRERPPSVSQRETTRTNQRDCDDDVEIICVIPPPDPSGMPTDTPTPSSEPTSAPLPSTPLPSIDEARSRAAETLGRGRRTKRPNSKIFNDDFVSGSFSQSINLNIFRAKNLLSPF